MNKIIALLAVTLFTACSHPLEIVGEGDIFSASGTRDCLWEDFNTENENCTENLVATNYDETYFAVSRSGWHFDRWLNFCTESTDNECSFDVPANDVKLFWGRTTLPLIAVFVPDDSIPAASTIHADGRTWAQVELFEGVSWNDVNTVCAEVACEGSLNNYVVDGWAWATVEDMNDFFNYYLGANFMRDGPDSFSLFSSDTMADFLADGWQYTAEETGADFVTGHVVDSYDGAQGYLAEVEDRSRGFFKTNTYVDKSAATTEIGAWLYQLQELVGHQVVNGKVWAQPDLFLGVYWNQIMSACPAGVCGEGAILNGYYMEGWTLASVADANALFNDYIGNDLLGPGPDSASGSFYNRMLEDGFRQTVDGTIIMGALLDVEPSSDWVHVGYFGRTDSGAQDAGTDRTRPKDSSYQYTGAWFHRPAYITDNAVLADGREWAQPKLFRNLSWDDIAQICPSDGVCAGTLNGLDVSGWRWASVDDVFELFSFYGVTPTPIELGDEIHAIDVDWYINFIEAGFHPTKEKDYQSEEEIQGWTSSYVDDDSFYGALLYLKSTYHAADNDEGTEDYFSNTAGSYLSYPHDGGDLHSGAWLYRTVED